MGSEDWDRAMPAHEIRAAHTKNKRIKMGLLKKERGCHKNIIGLAGLSIGLRRLAACAPSPYSSPPSLPYRELHLPPIAPLLQWVRWFAHLKPLKTERFSWGALLKGKELPVLKPLKF